MCMPASCAPPGHEVLFICATDEHGTPAEIAALEAGAAGRGILRRAARDPGRRSIATSHLSFDYFGRSSSPQNHELTNHFYHRLDDAGFIEERAIAQVYSVDDGRFLPDRYITGTCPHCGYANARGDQCENCTRLLEPTDLIDARSAISGSRNLEVRQTKHLFLKLAELADRVEEWIDSRKDWPLLVSSIAKAWLKEGLQDRGITRDLKWGVPVDRPGFEGKVFYVWFDAPIEYIGATKEWADAAPRRTATGSAGGSTPTTSATSSSWPRTTCRSTRSASRRRSSARASRGSWPTTSRAFPG